MVALLFNRKLLDSLWLFVHTPHADVFPFHTPLHPLVWLPWRQPRVNNCLSSRELVLALKWGACFLMYACLIWILPAAWGLHYSCLDRELSLKALEQSQGPARDSGASDAPLRGASVIQRGKKGDRQRDMEIPLPGFTLIEISFALK